MDELIGNEHELWDEAVRTLLERARTMDEFGEFEFLKVRSSVGDVSLSDDDNALLEPISAYLRLGINPISILVEIYMAKEEAPWRGFLFCDWLERTLSDHRLRDECEKSIDKGRRIERPADALVSAERDESDEFLD